MVNICLTHSRSRKKGRWSEKSAITERMEATVSPIMTPLSQKPRSGSTRPPYSQQWVQLTKEAYIDLTCQVHYWRAQYELATKREAALQATIAAQQATIRALTQRLYGTKSEKATRCQRFGPPQARPPRKRGHQPGTPGHGRQDRSALPRVVEVYDLREAEKRCAVWGVTFRSFPGPEASTILEVQVQAHVRHIHRQRYQKACRCAQQPAIITAPPAPRLLPKSPFGVSVWTEVLLDKYLYGRPTSRLCQALQHHGVPLAPGTLTAGLHKLTPLVEPLQEALRARQMGEKLFHSDETRWNVFAPLAGKAHHRWYLWVTRSASVVLYQSDPSRGAAVPKAHFAQLQPGLGAVVLVCDRYSAYKCLAKEHDKMILAHCWAHVRRDFLTAARSWPEVAPWMWKWLDDIRTLYQLTTARLAVWDATASLERQSPAFVVCHQALTAPVQQMQERWVMYRRERDLHPAKRPLLDSLHHHWEGLTVFLTRPEVPLDNNSAERALRHPVVSRKTYYGSGSLWSARLAAMLWSILQTVRLWGLNPRHWLSAFLQACMAQGGTTPLDLSAFLPWQMTVERTHQLAQPAPVPALPQDITASGRADTS
jgi:transposase